MGGRKKQRTLFYLLACMYVYRQRAFLSESVLSARYRLAIGSLPAPSRPAVPVGPASPAEARQPLSASPAPSASPRFAEARRFQRSSPLFNNPFNSPSLPPPRLSENP
jgi:hypothetical protein